MLKLKRHARLMRITTHFTTRFTTRIAAAPTVVRRSPWAVARGALAAARYAAPGALTAALVVFWLILSATAARGQPADLAANWSKQFYGAYDFVSATAADTSGVYAVGWRQYTNQLGANSEPFIRKYDPSGNFLWGDQFGSSISQMDQALGVAVDASGNVYVVGRITDVGQAPGSSAPYPNYDAFVRKYSAAGQLVWSSQFGTTGSSGNPTTDWATGVAVDSTGVYVVGAVFGPLPDQSDTTGGAPFVRKYGLDGQVAWTHELTSNVVSPLFLARGVAVDATGVYVVGEGSTFDYYLDERYFTGFVEKFQLDGGGPLWFSYAGGVGYDANAMGVAVSGGGVYVAMQRASMDSGTLGSAPCDHDRTIPVSAESEVDQYSASDGSFVRGAADSDRSDPNAPLSADSVQSIAIDAAAATPTIYVTGVHLDSTGYDCVAYIRQLPLDLSSVSAPTTFGTPGASGSPSDNVAMSVSVVASGTYIGGHVTCPQAAFVAQLGSEPLPGCGSGSGTPTPSPSTSPSPTVTPTPLKITAPDAIPEGLPTPFCVSGDDPDGGPSFYQWDLDNNGTFESPGSCVNFTPPDLEVSTSQTVIARACNINTGACASISKTIPIDIVEPTATGLTATPATVTTNGTFTLALTNPQDPSSTPDDPANLTYAFDCGGGAFSATQSTNSFLCSAPTSVGQLTVQGQVCDDDGCGIQQTTVIVIVSGDTTTPTADAGGPYTVAEGSGVSLLGAGRDADGDPVTYSWDLIGDGTWVDGFQFCGTPPNTFSCPGPDQSFDANSGYDGPTTTTVTLRVCDDQTPARCGYSAATVTITNAPPSSALLHAPTRVATGATFTLSVTNVTDPSAADQAAGFDYAFDCGDGNGFSAFAHGAASLTCVAPSASGPITVQAEVRDKDGGVYVIPSTKVDIGNRAPTTSAATLSAPEGIATTVRLAGSGTDPDGDTLTYAWDLNNDGVYETVGQVAQDVVNVDDGPSALTVGLRVCDQPPPETPAIPSLCTTTTATINILNVTPTGAFNFLVSAVGQPFTLSITNPYDPSAADRAAGYSYAFDCGEGSGYGAFGAASSATCAWPTAPGKHTVRGKIQDKDSGVYEFVAAITFTDSSVSIQKGIVTDPSWKYSYTLQSGWEQPGFDDSSWSPVLAPSGGLCAGDSVPQISGSPAVPVWGANPQANQTIYLRKDFSLDGIGSGSLQTSLSDDGDIYVDGTLIRHDVDGMASGVFQDPISSLPAGQNVIAIKGISAAALCQWVEADLSITTLKTIPAITWNTPADITYGTPLGAAQLNAASSAPGTFTYSPASGVVLDAGANQILQVTFTPDDATAYLPVTQRVSINVLKAPLTVTANNASKQYSDPAPALTGAVTGVQNGDPITARYATTTTLSSAPGTYPITPTLVDPSNRLGNYVVTLSNGTLTVTQEDARATYTGALFVSTSSTTSSTATVTLSATVQDITAVASDPAYDAYPGDIRKATVSFVDRDSGATLCNALPVGLVSLSDTTTGTATCNWTANIGSGDGAQYTVGVIVGSYYTRDASADDALVTVAKPISSNVIRGGGYLILSHSAGQIPGDTGSRASFSFVVRYGKKGTISTGSGSLIITSGGHTYRITGTAITSVAVNTTAGTATLNVNASIQDITNPRHAITIDSNASVQVTMTDKGTPGTNDTLGVTVWNKSGGLWFASNWNGTRTLEQNLASGNLIVS
ncbi:MAG TPA: MBG domain-containing protein [Ktedonobacterales bacterium]|nr:MBG domain-containing protein [Ktedonobacterales bacterium]